MPLPQHISEALRCDPNLDEDELLEFLDNAVADQLPWFLHDQEAKSSLCGAVFGNTAALSSEIFELKGAPPELKFITVFQDAAQFRALLLVPDVEFLTTAIPTAALVCIAKCWPSNANFLDVRNPSVIPDGLKRKAVIFLLASGLQGWEQSNLIDTLLSLAGYVTEDATAARAGPPDWTASSTFEFGGGALVSSEPMMAGRLLQESIRESRVRWRFIALYRICEAAYLVSLKEQFTRDFLDSPGSVLSEIKNALESERATFQKLVEENDVKQEFELVRAIIDADTTNQFLHAIKRSLRESKEAGWRKGVSYVYKLRCATVHAGQNDVVFERFADAESGLRLTLPALEAAVFRLLGIAKP